MAKYLGMASAYAYARSKGYEGTEEEFAELMADYADVGQIAVAAKNDAIAAKDDAVTAKNSAVSAKESAESSASSAASSDSAASASAVSAASSASAANTSAGLASDAKEDAITAKNSAIAAKDNAITAKDDAVTAKNSAVSAMTAAETAQGLAEDARDTAQGYAESINPDSYVRFTAAQTHTDAQKRTAINNIAVYDTLIQAYRITDRSTTMGDIQTFLNSVNSNNDVMMFNLSALADGFYLCTIYLGSGYYRIADQVTGFLKSGFFKTTDLLIDILTSAPVSTGKHYTVEWDKALAQCTRLNDAASITTDTTNFGHFGAVNENYSNPFDNIYPWSGRKLCNIDISTYMDLSEGDNIEDCVVAWEGDSGFSYTHQYGVWVYTPGFFGRRYAMGNKLYFDVSDELTQYNKEYKPQITGRWNGVQTTLSIEGQSKTVILPLASERQICNTALSTMHTYAKNYGASLVDIYALDATLLLYIVEYANFNSQLKLGNGVSSIYEPDLHAAANVSDSNIVTFSELSAANITRMKAGAEVMIGTTSTGSNIGVSTITAVSTEGTTTTVTLANAYTFTTADYFTIRGMINTPDSEIGSRSGYIGDNSYSHAYYRGECLYGNKFSYILGAYRQGGTTPTNKVYIAKEGTSDNFDALNTSEHIDTGVVLADTSSYVKTLGFTDGLCMSVFATEVGSSYTANPVGDYLYNNNNTSDTVMLLGGNSRDGGIVGLFYGDWAVSASSSSWDSSARPSLVNP